MKSIAKPKMRHKWRVVKWDCEQVPECENPEQDPRCLEIVEGEVGGPKKTIYKRIGE